MVDNLFVRGVLITVSGNIMLLCIEHRPTYRSERQLNHSHTHCTIAASLTVGICGTSPSRITSNIGAGDPIVNKQFTRKLSHRSSLFSLRISAEIRLPNEWLSLIYKSFWQKDVASFWFFPYSYSTTIYLRFYIRSFKFRSVNIDGDLAPDRRKEFFGSYSMPSGLCFYSVSSNADLLRDTTALRLYICRFQTEIYIYGLYIADLNKA